MVEQISCRLPHTGSCRPIAAADHIQAVPLDRWDVDGPKAPGLGASFGGFVADWARFDAALFGVSPSEAAMMDPQQRVLLEVTCCPVLSTMSLHGVE